MRPQFPCTTLQNTVLLLQLAFTRKLLTPLPTLSFFSPLAPKIYGKETEYSLYLLKNTADGPRAPGKLRGKKPKRKEVLPLATHSKTKICKGQGRLSSNPSPWCHQSHKTSSQPPEHLPSNGAEGVGAQSACF